jgi:hypothetical protein
VVGPRVKEVRPWRPGPKSGIVARRVADTVASLVWPQKEIRLAAAISDAATEAWLWKPRFFVTLLANRSLNIYQKAAYRTEAIFSAFQAPLYWFFVSARVVSTVQVSVLLSGEAVSDHPGFQIRNTVTGLIV